MDASHKETALWPLVRSLGHNAVAKHGVPEHLASFASHAAAARFAYAGHTPLDEGMRRRVAAYFWGTVRRRAIRHAPDYAQRIVDATLAADAAQESAPRGASGGQLQCLELLA